MKRNARKNPTIHLLRWVFQRENQLITCQLDREGRQSSYTLSLVPHWDVRRAVSENFDAGVPEPAARNIETIARLEREALHEGISQQLGVKSDGRDGVDQMAKDTDIH